MKSWRCRTLLFVCLILIRLHLSEAGCADYFKLSQWVNMQTSTHKPPITMKNLTETFQLVDAENLKDIMICTLQNELTNKRYVEHLLSHCLGVEPADKIQVKCGNITQHKVYFYDFMCLVAKASDLQAEVCVNELVTKWLDSKLTTTPPPPPATTTTAAAAAAAKPTTAAAAAAAKPTTAAAAAAAAAKPTTWSSSLADSTTQSTAKTSRTQTTIGQTPEKNRMSQLSQFVYAVLAISLLLNVAFLLWLLFFQEGSKSNPNHSPRMNGSPENINLMQRQPKMYDQTRSNEDVTATWGVNNDAQANCEDEYQV